MVLDKVKIEKESSSNWEAFASCDDVPLMIGAAASNWLHAVVTRAAQNRYNMQLSRHMVVCHVAQ